jgi:hypothetical protein
MPLHMRLHRLIMVTIGNMRAWSMRLFFLTCVAVVPLAGCHAAPKESTLLKNIHDAGTAKPKKAPKENLTAFQGLLRSRLTKPSPVTSIFAIEVDVPDGDGDAGSYLAVVHTGARAELQYFEQRNHQPRMDRFYHRALTPDETAQFDSFLITHPIASLRVPEETGDTNPDTLPVIFHLTDAQLKDTQAIQLETPGPDDHPAVDLIAMLRTMRDASPLSCIYTQSIPPSASLMFADPFRAVRQVWVSRGEVRAEIAERANPLSNPDEQVPARWFTLKENQWVTGDPPPNENAAATEPATQPAASQPATRASETLPAAGPAPAPVPFVPLPARPANTGRAMVPADAAANPRVLQDVSSAAPAASQPLEALQRFSTPDLLPREESWWTQPSSGATIVWHYVPLTKDNGQQVGFTVPAFIFDDQHMALDLPRRTLYLIHDGHLFSLPIPQVALVH